MQRVLRRVVSWIIAFDDERQFTFSYDLFYFVK